MLVAIAAELGVVGLVFASPERYVHAAITLYGLDRHLRAMVTGDDVRQGKPASDPYLLAASQLGLPPVRCLAVEDSTSGIRSAHAAGMTVLAIPNATTALDFTALDFTALDFTALGLADHVAADAYVAAKALPVLVG